MSQLPRNIELIQAILYIELFKFKYLICGHIINFGYFPMIFSLQRFYKSFFVGILYFLKICLTLLKWLTRA